MELWPVKTNLGFFWLMNFKSGVGSAEYNIKLIYVTYTHNKHCETNWNCEYMNLHLAHAPASTPILYENE